MNKKEGNSRVLEDRQAFITDRDSPSVMGASGLSIPSVSFFIIIMYSTIFFLVASYEKNVD